MAGGSGDDTFNATMNATGSLNSFDSISGGGGTDTVNIASTTGAAFAMPSSATVSGVEVVNVNHAGTAGTNAVTVTDTTFGTGVKKLYWTEAGVGTTAAVAVTLNSATDVSVVSTGVTFTTAAITDTSTTVASTGSTLKNITLTKVNGAQTLTGNGITSLSLNTQAGGVATVTAAAATRELTVNTAGTGNITGVTDATATTLTLKNTGIQTLGTYTAASATTVNVDTTAAATALVITAAAATKLNVSGTATVAAVITGSAALTEINISGAGAGLTSVVDLSGIATGLTAITSTATSATATAAGNTLGATTVTAGFGNGVTFTGGAGNDTITVGATTKTINVGAGTNKVFLVSGTTALGTNGAITATTGSTDTLSMVNADAVSLTTNALTTGAAFKTAVTGFEVLDAGTATAATISMTAFGSFNEFNVITAAVTQTLSGVTSGKTLTLNEGAAAITSLTANNLSGSADTMTIKLKGDLSAGNVAFGTVTNPGVETLTITTVDSNTTFVTKLASLTVVDTAATSIAVTGNNGLALTFAGTALTNFDASGLTKGAVTYTSGVLVTDTVVKGSVSGGDTLNFGNATALITITSTAGDNALTGSGTFASTINGGTGIDTIVGGTAVDTINGGAGADIITGGKGNDVMTGGAGADAFRWVNTAGTTNHATIGGFDTITDFVVGTDTLSFTGATDIVSVEQAAVQTAVSALSAGSTAAQIANAMANANATNLGVAFATFGGDTYVLFETAGGGATFVVADDIFIKLSGITSIPTYANSVV
jgi:S-layer protein